MLGKAQELAGTNKNVKQWNLRRKVKIGITICPPSAHSPVQIGTKGRPIWEFTVKVWAQATAQLGMFFLLSNEPIIGKNKLERPRLRR